MKAKLIRENIHFERSRDARKTLGIGKIHKDHFESVIVTALEGGSNYWYLLRVEEFRKDLPDKSRTQYGALSERITLALYENPSFKMNVYDAENEDDLLGTVTQESMFKAFEIAEKDYKYAYDNIMEENYDASDADILFQLATMGEVVFG